jgi:hypothetical protein
LTQGNETEIVAPRHYNGSNIRGNKNKFSNDPKKRAQELKFHYHSHFIQSSGTKSSNIFYNFYYKLGHILFECQLRKGNNNANVV